MEKDEGFLKGGGRVSRRGGLARTASHRRSDTALT